MLNFRMAKEASSKTPWAFLTSLLSVISGSSWSWAWISSVFLEEDWPPHPAKASERAKLTAKITVKGLKTSVFILFVLLFDGNRFVMLLFASFLSDYGTQNGSANFAFQATLSGRDAGLVCHFALEG